MNWNEIISDYNKRKKEEEERGINEFRKMCDEIIRQLKSNEKADIIGEGKLPKKLTEFAMVEPKTGNIVSKKFPEYVLVSLTDLIELSSNIDEDEE